MAAIERSRSTPQPQVIASEASTLQFETSSLVINEQGMVSVDTSTGQGRTLSEITTPGIEEVINEDGILCKILSSLTLAEAVRTSALSSRWRHFWPCRTTFRFDAINVLDAQTITELDNKEAYYLTKGKTDKFIRAVDSVLNQLHGARVDELSIQHFLDKRHSQHIDAWVRFAVESKTKMLRIHPLKSFSTPTKLYHFPCHLLGSLPYLETLGLMNCSLKVPLNFDGLINLQKLSLGNVDVTQEDFHCILYNCSTTLLKLGLLQAPGWESLSIPHPLCQLHALLVTQCHLRKIEINAVNLRKLIYQGVPLDFRFRQSLKLNDADICFKIGGAVHNLDFYLTNLASSLPHLQSLTLKISGNSQVADLPKGSSRFIHLTRLDFEWNTSVRMSLLHLATLLDAAPIMKYLKLRLSARVEEQQPSQTPNELTEMLQLKHAHSHLNTIDVSGFYFDAWEVNIAVYLLKNASKLELMTIEKGNVSEEIYEMVVKNLNQEIPADVKLVIL